MSRHRKRLCRSQTRAVSFIWTFLLCFCCIESSIFKSNFLQGDEKDSDNGNRNLDREDENSMIEKLLSNEKLVRIEKRNEDKLCFFIEGILSDENKINNDNINEVEDEARSIIEKLLSEENEDENGDVISSIEKAISKVCLLTDEMRNDLNKVLIDNYPLILEALAIKKRLSKKDFFLNEYPPVRKRFYNFRESEESEDDFEIKKRINKSIQESEEDDDDPQEKRSKKNVGESEISEDDPEIKKRLTKKNVRESEENDDDEQVKRSKKKVGENENSENDPEFKKRLFKKNVREREENDNNPEVKSYKRSFEESEEPEDDPEIKKRLIKKGVHGSQKNDDDTDRKSSKKTFDKSEESDDLSEIRKRLTKKNVRESEENDEHPNVKRSKKDFGESEESEDQEIKKRLIKKGVHGSQKNDDDTDRKRSKKTFDKSEESDDLSEIRKRLTKKNVRESEENDEHPNVKRSKKDFGESEESEDQDIKKRITKKNVYEIDDEPKVRKRKIKKNVFENEETKDGSDDKRKRSENFWEIEETKDDYEVKNRLLKNNSLKKENFQDEILEINKRLSKKRLSEIENVENEESEQQKRIFKKKKKNKVEEEEKSDDEKRLFKKNLSEKEYINQLIEDGPAIDQIFSSKNVFRIRNENDDNEDEGSIIEKMLANQLIDESEKRYLERSTMNRILQNEDQISDTKRNIDLIKERLDNSAAGRELPILKLSPHAMIHDVALDRNDTHHLYWQVDYNAESLRMEIHSRAVSPHPWMSIGFSDRGEFVGGDMCVFWVDWKSRAHFQNAFVDAYGRLVISPTQECRHFRYRLTEGVLKLTFTRRFDTCQPHHYVIERGTTHIIWAWGDGPLFTLDGVLAEGDEHGMIRVELLKPLLSTGSLEETEEIDITSNGVTVPTQETTYWCTVRKLPERFEEKHHIFRFAPKIQKRNEDLVHHMEVFHCEYPPEFQVPQYQGPCHADDRPKEIDACKRVLAAWAMGALPFSYPEEAGLPFGGPDFSPFVMLEVHYNNPELFPKRVDSSGMTLTYSRRLRQHDAAIMELGLEYTSKMAIPPRMQSFVLKGYCIPECTAVGLEPAGIYIFGSQLHTHLTGVRTWTKHYRGDVELPELNRDNHYSTHFQEIRRLPQSIHVLPGDALVMGCEHQTLDRTNVTVGGYAISDEMCVNYVHYYPKAELEVCKSSIDSKTLIDYFEAMNTLELQPTSPKFDWRKNYNSIQWSPLRANFLQEMYNDATVSMQCNKSSGERFPGYWENKRQPTVLYQLPVPERKCNFKEHFKRNEEIIIV